MHTSGRISDLHGNRADLLSPKSVCLKVEPRFIQTVVNGYQL